VSCFIALLIATGSCDANVVPPAEGSVPGSGRSDALLISLQAKPTVTFILRSPSGGISTDSLTTIPDATRSGDHIFSELDGEYTGDFTLIEIPNPSAGDYVVELSTPDSTSVVLDAVGDTVRGRCDQVLRVFDPLAPGTTSIVFRYAHSDTGGCRIELVSDGK
jgi:hypothetical protein